MKLNDINNYPGFQKEASWGNFLRWAGGGAIGAGLLGGGSWIHGKLTAPSAADVAWDEANKFNGAIRKATGANVNAYIGKNSEGKWDVGYTVIPQKAVADAANATPKAPAAPAAAEGPGMWDKVKNWVDENPELAGLAGAGVIGAGALGLGYALSGDDEEEEEYYN